MIRTQRRAALTDGNQLHVNRRRGRLLGLCATEGKRGRGRGRNAEGGGGHSVQVLRGSAQWDRRRRVGGERGVDRTGWEVE